MKSPNDINDGDRNEIMAQFNINRRPVFYTMGGLRAKHKRKLRYTVLPYAMWRWIVPEIISETAHFGGCM